MCGQGKKGLKDNGWEHSVCRQTFGHFQPADVMVVSVVQSSPFVFVVVVVGVWMFVCVCARACSCVCDCVCV